MIWRDVLFADVWLVRRRDDLCRRDTRRAASRWPAQALAHGARRARRAAAAERDHRRAAARRLCRSGRRRSTGSASRSSCSPASSPAMRWCTSPTTTCSTLKRRVSRCTRCSSSTSAASRTISGENQFPVAWTPEQTALLSPASATTRSAGTFTGHIEPCHFVMQRLERKDDKIFGTPRLAEAWRDAVAGASPRLSAAPRDVHVDIPRRATI